MSQLFGPVFQIAYVVEHVESAIDHMVKTMGVGPFFMFPVPLQTEWFEVRGERVGPDYDFLGAPRLATWGAGARITIIDCANFNYLHGSDINRNPTFTPGETPAKVKITYSDMNKTRWDLMAPVDFELGPYNRVSRQAQELGFGGGYLCKMHIGINVHHNSMTGGGCAPAPGAHIEWWQQILAEAGTGSYAYIEDNMIDYSVDGQDDPAITEGWTAATVSTGGDCAIKFNRNVVKGLDIVQKRGRHPPGGFGCIVAYGDDNVRAGFEFNDNAIAYLPPWPSPTYKHGGGLLKPTQSGNRWFRDADSDAAGCVGPADNVALTLDDFG